MSGIVSRATRLLAVIFQVGILQGLCPKPGAVVVGPAAWNAYIDMPLQFDGLDFAVAATPGSTPRPDFLPDLLFTVVKVASTVMEVQHALCVLEVCPPA
jgi:hypothetical protein